MLKLYYVPGNASLIVHMALNLLEVPVELILVDRTNNANRTPEYLALNPNGLVPTLVDGDLVLWETAAILLHLVDKYPNGGLAPAVGTAERAHFYKWLIHLTNTIQPEYLVYYYPERHTTDPAGVPAVQAKSCERLAEMFALVDRELGDKPYLLGDRMSVVDCFLVTLVRWGRNLPVPPRSFPHVGRHAQAMLAHPVIAQTVVREGLSAPII